MPKLKTKKTLSKRVRITKKGKIVKKQNETGHLKAKRGVNRKLRKKKRVLQTNSGHIKKFKRMLNI